MLVVFCLGLLAAVGAVFTRVIAARVPQQRATLEKLIADRTGLDVRFDNVRFSWGLDGASAVFERVELTDTELGRVRVVAPELRIEFDAWDYLRHQQFTLGHVTISSPDIEIVGEVQPAQTFAGSTRAAPARLGDALREEDEAALVRHFTAWAELMPIGRVEVEGARVHLLRGGDRAPLHSFTLSQADINRGAHSLNAFGTMLLSQDVGQSLFVSVKFNGLGAPDGVSGDLRLIARRVLLDKLGLDVARGRGTLDARLELRKGLIHSAEWQASARELELTTGKRFDHFTVNAVLRRARTDVLLEFNDLQITRGARLERSPRLTARLVFAPHSVRLERVTAQSERVPFMATEFIAGVFAPQLDSHLAQLPEDWSANAGELRDVRFDSQRGSLEARMANVEIARADGARVGHLAASLAIGEGRFELAFDPSQSASLWMPGATEPREMNLAGTLGWRQGDLPAQLAFAKLKLTAGEASMVADGDWGLARGSRPLSLELTEVDRALLGDLWNLLQPDAEFPQLADVSQGRIVTGKLQLVPAAGENSPGVNWQRSRGTLALAELSSAGADGPRLSDAGGKLDFSRLGTQLRLTSGRIDDLQLTGARIDWPREGAPRLQASLQGELQAPMMQDLLREHGLERLTGTVSLEADARGEEALRDPTLWRVTARVSDASIPLAADLPPAQDLTGTVRYANHELRGLALEGSWLGGPLKIDSRRAASPGALSANISGVADAAPLLKLLGHPDASELVSGQITWSGTLQRLSESTSPEGDAWQLSLNSTLTGVESRLPEPFDKARARAVNIHAELRLDARGVREFDIESGRDAVHGRLDRGATQVSFDVQGLAGRLSAAEGDTESRLALERLELRRAPVVLAAAGALLPQDASLVVQVSQLRQADRSLGALKAELGRRDTGLEFTLESAEGTPHDLNARGACSSQADCRMEFTFGTQQLGSLLAVNELPAEWPTRSLQVSGELAWRADTSGDFMRALGGRFDIEAWGADDTHQLAASATLADGQVDLANVQGSGPESDQVFRGSGHIGLLARNYDLTVDYERVSLAASAVPTPARVGLARAWTVLRGSVGRKGWAETEPARRVQWHGSWD